MMFALPIVSGKYPDKVARVYHHHTKQSIRLKPARSPGGLMGEVTADFIFFFIAEYFQLTPFCKGFFCFYRSILANVAIPVFSAF